MGGYEDICRNFRWDIPPAFNLGASLCSGGPAGPKAEAVVVSNGGTIIATYTFHQLDQYSNRMANMLVASGYTPGSVIGIMLPQSLEAAVATLAILKAGMVCMPMVQDSPASSCADWLVAAKADGFISSESIIERHHAWLTEIMPANRIHPILAASGSFQPHLLESILCSASDKFTPIKTSAASPAFLSFTSGSEGAPKGVLHGHQIVPGIRPTFHFTGVARPVDRSWSHFDWGWLGGLLVALGNWSFGAATVIENPVQPVSPASLRMMTECGVTRAAISPTALRMLKVGTQNVQFPALRSLSTGGETLDQATYAWAKDRFGIELSELYGLTECSGVLGSGPILSAPHGALGKAVPGQDVRIVGEDGQELPPGEEGMIAVKAPHPAMFLGYLANEEETRRKYIGDLLGTGDTGWRDDQGFFYYSGRADDLIKVGGRRIGPGEIEAAIAELPGVADCAVTGIPDALTGQRLVAWIQLEEGADRSGAAKTRLLSELRSRLPAYQVPSQVRLVQSLPLTANGKVSRRQIRESEARPADA